MDRLQGLTRALMLTAVCTVIVVVSSSGLPVGFFQPRASGIQVVDAASAVETTAAGGGILHRDGTLNEAAYRRIAANMGSAAGVQIRFGIPSRAARDSARSTAPEPPDRVRNNHGYRRDTTYQVGGPQDAAKNDYSNNQGQVGYLPIGDRTDNALGVDHVETLAMGENTFSQKPQLAWQYYGGGHPEPDFLADKDSARCIAAQHRPPGSFVAQARAYAKGEATAATLVAFSNGVIAAAGTNTARGRVCVALPEQLRPTSISLTNGNEFALVTVWNTRRYRSELAVIALGSRNPQGDFWNNEWTRLYPGFRNYGNPSFAKYLGSVPLPMVAAVGVSAVSDYSMGEWLYRNDGSYASPGNFSLFAEANRRSFIDGANAGRWAKSGYAVVFSRLEKKVTFVDLQPLFSSISGAYFGSRADFLKVAQNVGLGAKQWPYPLSRFASARPRVLRTIHTLSTPTSVAALLSGPKTPYASVGTSDGHVRFYSVGGLASSGKASAASIRLCGTVKVGRNPTSITYVKEHWGVGLKESIDDTLIVTSRRDRKVQWLRLDKCRATVTRTLADSRLIDPIASEDNNNHGTESYVLSVADYGAARLFNYRYGPVIFHTNGGERFDLRKGAQFEFGGYYNPGGRPYSISITNVT